MKIEDLALYHEGNLEWDPKNLRVANNKKADRDITRDYRDGWDPEQYA